MSRPNGIGAAVGIAGLLLAVLAAVLHVTSALAADPVIDAAAAYRAARDGDLTLIDVRTVGEWGETGVAAGAAPISLMPAWGRPNPDFVADVEALVGGDRDRPIALICATGGRSAYARELLADNGFTTVLSVAEGMLGSSAGPGWMARGLPTTPCPECR